MEWSLDTVKQTINNFEEMFRDRTIARDELLVRMTPFLSELANAPEFVDACHSEIASLVSMYTDILYTEGRLVEALEVSKNWFGVLEGKPNTKGEARRLYTLGLAYVNLSRFEDALPYMLEAHKTAISANLGYRIESKIVNGVAYIYSMRKQHEEALYWYRRGLEIIDEESEPNGRRQTLLSNMCITASDAKKYDLAISYGEQSFEIWRNSKNRTFEQERIYAYAHNNLARAWFGKGEVETAEQYYSEGLHLNRRTKDKLGILYSLRGLGEIEHVRGSNESALFYFQEAAEMAGQINALDEEADCFRLMADSYHAAGDFEHAFDYLQRYHSIEQTLNEQKSRHAIENLQVQYETEIAMLEARALRGENEVLEKRVATRVEELRASLKREEILGSQLQDALEVSEQVSELRSKMIQTISHELRTPITIIGLSTALLKKNYGKMPAEKKSYHFEKIESNIQSLRVMLDNASTANELHRNASSQVGTERVPIAEIVKSMTGRLASIERINLHVQGRQDQYVTLNQEQWLMAITAVIDNALTLSSESIEVCINTEQSLSIEIKDHGIGISEEELPHIFDLFYRSPRVAFDRGLGIGLFSVKQMLALMGGMIQVVSDGIDQGTTVTLKLPFARSIR